MEEVDRELEDPGVWDNPERAQELGRERSRLDHIVNGLDRLASGIDDAHDLLELAAEEDDKDTLASIPAEIAALRGYL